MLITFRAVLLLGVIGVVVSLVGAFGIAWGVVEWRGDQSAEVRALRTELSGTLAELEGSVTDLADARDDLEGRVEELEIPQPIADRDIQELYARTNYAACVWDANVALDNASWEEESAYNAYLADNLTYGEYERVRADYEGAYDTYDGQLDSCWDVYVDESPYGDDARLPGSY